jgi:hypothetical protein
MKISNLKLQTSKAIQTPHAKFWNSMIEASLGFGVWSFSQ